MTKQEILEAIDSTIVANDKKAITAESLANILREMATATPEGGSGGSGGEEVLRFLFIDPILGPELVLMGEGEISKDFLDMIKVDIGDEAYMFTPILEYYDKMFSHNTEMYNKLKEAALAGKGVQTVLDMSEGTSIALKCVFEMQGTRSDEFGCSMQFSADPSFIVMSYMGESEDESGLVVNSAILSSMLNIKGPVSIKLFPDGGFLVLPSTYDLTIPNENYSLEEAEQKENKRTYGQLEYDTDPSLLRVWYNDGYSTKQVLPLYISKSPVYVTFLFDTDIIKATLSEDGSVTATKIGSINTTA